MVQIRHIRRLAAVAGFILVTICFSCENELVIGIICSECESDEPLEAGLELKLDGDSGFRSTIVTIYEGNVEDNVVLKSLEINSDKRTINVPLNKKYTVTARYFRDGQTYLAIDSTTPRVRYDKTSCDKPCFWVYNKTLNLRLK